jgi:hypothetical protein
VFIEFPLPDSRDYNFVLTIIKINIEQWAHTQNIPYTQKTVKYTHRLAFDNDQHYTVFALTWQPTPELEYKIIDRK